MLLTLHISSPKLSSSSISSLFIFEIPLIMSMRSFTLFPLLFFLFAALFFLFSDFYWTNSYNIVMPYFNKYRSMEILQNTALRIKYRLIMAHSSCQWFLVWIYVYLTWKACLIWNSLDASSSSVSLHKDSSSPISFSRRFSSTRHLAISVIYNKLMVIFTFTNHSNTRNYFYYFCKPITMIS